MTLEAKTKSLAAQLIADAEASASRAARDAERKLTLARAWDEAGFTACAPWILHAHNPEKSYARDAGSFAFRDTPIYNALALLEAFPPVACGLYRDWNTTSLRPMGTETERYTLDTETDGVQLRADGGIDYGQTLKLEWWAELPAMRVQFTVELAPDYQTLPQLRAPIQVIAGEARRFTGPSTLVWPDSLPFRGKHIRYARGSDTGHNPIMVYTGVREYLERAQAQNDVRGKASRKAYELAAAGLPAPRKATAAEIESHAEQYAREKLRQGTLAQHATLRTSEALAHYKLAEAMPREYALAHGLEPYRYGFDHYGVTVYYLTQCDLLTDGGYKYGSAWL